LLLGTAAYPQEPELLADVPAATAAGFRILDLRRRSGEEYSGLVRDLVAEFASKQGIRRSVNADWSAVRLPGGQVLLLVAPLGAEFDVPGSRSGRLLVYAVKGNTAADLVLNTAAMAVGVDRGGEIAAVQEIGYRRFVWDGRLLQETH
jgi:hypothetical protein